MPQVQRAPRHECHGATGGRYPAQNWMNRRVQHLPYGQRASSNDVICKFLANYFQKNSNKQFSAITCSLFQFVTLVVFLWSETTGII